MFKLVANANKFVSAKQYDGFYLW